MEVTDQKIQISATKKIQGDNDFGVKKLERRLGNSLEDFQEKGNSGRGKGKCAVLVVEANLKVFKELLKMTIKEREQTTNLLKS